MHYFKTGLILIPFGYLLIINHQNGGDKPTAIVMDTFKGEGVDFMKDNYLWHYGSLDEEKTKQAYASLDAYYKERCERAEKEA